jgi:hypothetical protein
VVEETESFDVVLSLLLSLSLVCLYLVFFVLLDQVFCLYFFCRFPGIVTCGISFPLDQVVYLVPSSFLFHVQYLFYFVFFFAIDQIWWWSGKVRAVEFCFLIWCY